MSPTVIVQLSNECGGRRIIGGYKILSNHHNLSRTINLKVYPHSRIYIEFYLDFIDFWDGQSLIVVVDSKHVILNKSHSARNSAYSNECGNSTNDRLFRYSETIDHENETMNILFYVDPAQKSELASESGLFYYGVSNFKIRLREVEKMNEIRISYKEGICREGFHAKKVDNCQKLGYNEVYCEICMQCDILCAKCINETICTECLPGITHTERNECKVKKGKKLNKKNPKTKKLIF